MPRPRPVPYIHGGEIPPAQAKKRVALFWDGAFFLLLLVFPSGFSERVIPWQILIAPAGRDEPKERPDRSGLSPNGFSRLPNLIHIFFMEFFESVFLLCLGIVKGFEFSTAITAFVDETHFYFVPFVAILEHLDHFPFVFRCT